MRRKIIILVLIICAVISVIWTFQLLTREVLPSSIPGVVLRINLSQLPDYRLSLQQIALLQGYPSDYQLNIKGYYYILKILAEDNQILFTGQVSNTNIIFPPDDADSGFILSSQAKKSEDLTIVPMEEIMLNLPYYKKSQKLILSDENGTIKFETVIDHKKLQIPLVSNYLCGNGICDVSENVLSCISDCKYQIAELKEVLTTKILP